MQRASLSVLFGITLSLGCGGEDSTELFGAQRIEALDLILERSAMADLAREPRDWVRGSLRLRGARYDAVGIRFKGHRSLRSWAEKPAFKLDFDRYEKDRRVHGLSGLVLNNLVEDPTMLREQLGSQVFLALGVPASRTGFAELSVNGERFGLYALIEPIDEPFAERHFADSSGPLYEGEYGCDLYPADIWGFQHDGGEDKGRKDLLALSRAAAGAPSAWLFGKKPSLHRQRFMAYLATSALIADFDGYRHAHNYRLYRDPDSKLWSFIPWGLDRVFKQRLPVYDSHGRLAQLCFGDRTCRLEYVKMLHRAAQRFKTLALEKSVDRLDAMIEGAVARDPRRPYTQRKRADALTAMRQFIRERPNEVRAQIACWDGTRELDRDGDGAACMDCDDADPAIHPGAQEHCDGRDNDCSGLVDDAPACPCTDVRIEDASFSLCDLPMAWRDAKAFCEARGQSLAWFDSRTMSKQLQRATEDLREDAFWVGLDDLKNEGHYRWLNGDRPLRRLWAGGEPDAYACGQHCAALAKNGQGKLRDMHCATPNPFVCRALPPAP